MKAEELRLGNLFIEENSKKIIEVLGLEKDRIIFSGMFLENWQAKPITLTIEWLIKFGFDWDDNLMYYFLPYGENKLFIIDNDFVICDIDFNPEIKYVHQLQNIYFSLVGEELTRK